VKSFKNNSCHSAVQDTTRFHNNGVKDYFLHCFIALHSTTPHDRC
jgi:hypothetical protein